MPDTPLPPTAKASKEIFLLGNFFVETAFFSFIVLQCTTHSKNLFRLELSTTPRFLCLELDSNLLVSVVNFRFSLVVTDISKCFI